MTPSVRNRERQVLACVDGVPRTATEIWRRYAGIMVWKSMTQRHRRERKWVAGVLEKLSTEGKIIRGIESNSERTQTWVAFTRAEGVDADARRDDQP
jgi:hypothetical protein